MIVALFKHKFVVAEFFIFWRIAKMAVSVINKDKKASAEIIDHIDGEPFPITSPLEEKGITTITKENLEKVF
jgi:hypothetical protein